jgi:hypothetical protein
MGTLIKKLGNISYKGQDICIELNESAFSKSKREIHVQNDSFRFAFQEDEFLRMSACVLLAKKQLEIIKGYNENKK